MSTSRHGRGIIRAVFKNFFDSFKVLRTGTSFDMHRGNVVGKDPFGNVYYELPADPSRGKRRPQRWYMSPETHEKEAVGKSPSGGFDAEMPAEWESWLRHRREEPPTAQQVLNSLALADMKKRNAAKLEQQRIEELKAEGRYEGLPKPQDHEKEPFPKYDEYEVIPGDDPKQERKRWKAYRNPYMEEDGEEGKGGGGQDWKKK